MRRARASRPVDNPDDATAAEETAVRILNGATQSAAALQRRLRQRGFSALAARVAADRCRELGYVDDAALASALTRRLQGAGRGRASIAIELRKRGIARDAVDAAVGSIGPGDDEAGALDVGRKLLRRELGRDRDDGGARRRIAGALQRRGFASGVIAQTLRTLSTESRAPQE